MLSTPQIKAICDNALEGMIVTDNRKEIVYVNPAFSRVTGFEWDEIIGKSPRILQSGRHDATFYYDFWKALDKDGQWAGEIWNRRKNGQVYPEWLHVSVVRNAQGLVTHYVGVFSDLSEMKSSEHKLDYLARHDWLTALPNRLWFREQLDKVLNRAQEEKIQVGVLLVEIDGFKQINEVYGHSCGDILLQNVADRLRSFCCDQPLARLGGDEFGLIVEAVEHIENSSVQAAERIRELMKAPLEVSRDGVFLTVSIGISLFPRHGLDSDKMLTNASSALLVAKSHGRNMYFLYNQEFSESALKRLQTLTSLRNALDRNELVVFYQPLYDIVTGKPVGSEALVRWQHPTRGLVAPIEFIPLAEESGLIETIDLWVLEQSCKQMVEWLKADKQLDFVAVNLSGRLFARSDLARQIADILERAGLESRYLELEVTESMTMVDSKSSLSICNELRDLGISLAIDDFGTGYSSMMRLKRLPVQKLKIDQGFISGLPHNLDDIAIIRAVIAMAHSLGLKVVAEGIEGPEQARFMLEHDCNIGQGYWYSLPSRPETLDWAVRQIN